MQLYAGLDLHSRNTYIGILDQEFNRVFKKRVANNLELILQTLNPFGSQLKGLVVESTYNWYWLIDGLMDNGYQCVHLANPSAIKQYEGLKHADDQHDGNVSDFLYHITNPQAYLNYSSIFSIWTTVSLEACPLPTGSTRSSMMEKGFTPFPFLLHQTS